MSDDIKYTDLREPDDFGESERVKALVSPYLEKGEQVLWFGGHDEWRGTSATEKKASVIKVLKYIGFFLVMILLLATVILALLAIIIICYSVIEIIKEESNAKSGLYIVTNKSVMRLRKEGILKIPYGRVADVYIEDLSVNAGKVSILYTDKNITGDLAAKNPFKTLVFDSVEDHREAYKLINEAVRDYKRNEQLIK